VKNRLFIAFNDGLTVMEKRNGSMSTLGEFFSGRTVLDLIFWLAAW
jgi:hypothetical protein